NAGVLEKGTRTFVEAGSPQGGSASPLLANIYLHYVFDLWVQAWRKKRARGDVIVVRYAHDIVVGFEFKTELNSSGKNSPNAWRNSNWNCTRKRRGLSSSDATRRRTESASDWESRRPSIFSASSTSAGRRRRGGFWCFGRRFANACKLSCSR